VAFANIVVHEHPSSGSGVSFVQKEEISDFVSYSAGVKTLLKMITGFCNLIFTWLPVTPYRLL